MPRVLLTGFCAVPGPRRAGVQLRHVIKALTPLHTVDLLVVREGEQPYVERQNSVRVLRVPTQEADLKTQIQSFQRALRRQLDGADYDIVHCRDSWSGVPVLDARARLRYAVVYDLTRSSLGDSTGDVELDGQYARDEEACMTAADMVLVPTNEAATLVRKRGRPERVMLSPPGVDVDRFDWDDGPTGGTPRLLYVGSIDPGRGVRVLIRAMAAIVREVDARLVLAGPIAPRFEKNLQQGIAELRLADKVEVLGPIEHDQLPALIATATVCVVPGASDSAGPPALVYPTKLLEYMACRRPVVAPRRDAIAAVVENNREALLFEPGDPIDLARKVLRLLGEPLVRDRLANNAYERVRRDFTASAARRAIRAAYGVLADRFELESEAPEVEEPAKLEMLADDEFEATVFEEAPLVPPLDTGLNKIEPLDDALASLESTGSTSNQIAPRDDGSWTSSSLAAPPAPADDWVVTNVAAAVRGLAGAATAADRDPDPDPDSGTHTPIEGVALHSGLDNFVAGEIDVPTPPPPPRERQDTPAVEFTAASAILGVVEPEPDTGQRR